MAARPASTRRAGADPTKDFGLAMERVNRELEASGVDRPARQFHLRAGAWPARTARRWCVRSARCSARSSGRRAARAVSAMIRSSCRTAIARRSARWTRVKKNAMSHRMRAFEKLILSTGLMIAGLKRARAVRGLCALAVLPRQMPVLRLQFSHVRHGGIDEARFLAAYLARASSISPRSRRGAASPASSSAAARHR